MPRCHAPLRGVRITCSGGAETRASPDCDHVISQVTRAGEFIVRFSGARLAPLGVRSPLGNETTKDSDETKGRTESTLVQDAVHRQEVPARINCDSPQVPAKRGFVLEKGNARNINIPIPI